MALKENKQRFVVIIEKKIFKKFKNIAEKEQRSASNLAAKIIAEYIEQQTKE